ncbi:MAG: cellulase family glycosylhydrolase [Nocardioides sp.]
MLRRLVLTAVVAATVLAPAAPAVAGPAGSVGSAGSGAVAHGSTSSLPRLYATNGRAAAIRNDRRAEVLLRAVNVNQLAEYYQANPDLEPTIALTKRDFRQIAKHGFNSVRLLVSWSRLEPTPGAYDTDYVAEIREAVGWAERYGLYVVLDMHQDAYGVAVDTPLGTVCPAGTHPNNGWDGAPAWATITDGESTCTPGEREVAPAVTHAWQHFYDDTDGVQTHLVETWGRLARDFARNTTVAGFDLLNEPGFGLNPIGGNTTTDLGRFYRRAIAAIRAGERRGGGFSHIVFWEPSVLWSAGASRSVPDPGFTRDKNLVFAPHIYAESLSSDSIAEGFAAARAVAQRHGVTVWGGEWGFWPERPVDASDRIERYAAAEDSARWGGAWWSWKQACGDPHVVNRPGGAPDPVSGSLNRFSCPEQVNDGIDPAFGDVLSRPAPRAVPGKITRLTSDGRVGRLDLQGKHQAGAKRCSLRVFVPERFADASVRTRGIKHLQRRDRLGNVVLRGCVSDSFRLRVG